MSLNDSEYEYESDKEEVELQKLVETSRRFVAEWSADKMSKKVTALRIESLKSPSDCFKSLKSLKETKDDLSDQYLSASQQLEIKKKEILIKLGEICASSDTKLCDEMQLLKKSLDDFLLQVANNAVAKNENENS